MTRQEVRGQAAPEARRSRIRSLTLRSRLALWAALATGLAVLLVAAGLFFSVNRFLLAAQQDRLQSAATAVQAQVEDALRGRGRGEDGPGTSELEDSPGLDTRTLERIADAAPERRQLELRVLTVEGDQLLGVATPRFPESVGAALPRGDRLVLSPDRQYLVLARPLLRGQAALQVVMDARALSDAQRAFTRALALLVPLALLLALALGWAVAGRLLRPVQTLEEAARAIGTGGDLRRPVPGAGEGDELARLALTLQQSFGRLADSREREQSFLRAAAHDLRSPLAALQARVEGTLAHPRDTGRYQTELREVNRDITRLSTLANHLLLLARDPSALSRAPVPLRDLAAEAVDRARELSPEADIDLIAPTSLTVEGDRVLLGQAIWNLTANAVKHAPGATVLVTVRRRGSDAEVTVEDDGPGVHPAVLARLGEAFYRPSESRSGDGHGLGLALARRVAELHGGTLTLESAPGSGLRSSLCLPCYPAGHEPRESAVERSGPRRR